MLFNTTKMLKNATAPMYDCTLTAEEIHRYVVAEIKFYGSWDKFREAASLNLLANAARLQHVSTQLRKIDVSSQEGQIQQMYYIGLMGNIVAIFDRAGYNPDSEVQDDGIGELDDLFDPQRLLRMAFKLRHGGDDSHDDTTTTTTTEEEPAFPIISDEDSEDTEDPQPTQVDS